MTVKVKMAGDREGDSGNEGNRVKVFVEQMLVTRIFAATYIGRNYVHLLKDYRDVLKVNEEESDLIRDLNIVKKRIQGFYKGTMWAAITGPEDREEEALAGTCVWTKLQNVAFGSYWFMIQQVSFSEFGELVLNLKVIRKFEPKIETTPNVFDSSLNWDEIKTNLVSNAQVVAASIVTGLRELLTWHNTKESARFLSLLIMTIGTGLVYGLQYLGDYSIRFFREFNNFIKVMTPTFLAIIDMLSKIVGGFYLLIAMLLGGPNRAPMPQFPSLMAAPQKQFKPGYQRKDPRGYYRHTYYHDNI